MTHIQKELILSAIDSAKPNGVIVYSTCALTVQENEQVVQYALDNRSNVQLVDPGLDFGVEGFTAFRGKIFSDRMKWCRRYYPHTHNMDGFFVAKLIKTGEKSVSVQVQSKSGKSVTRVAGSESRAPALVKDTSNDVVEDNVAFDDEEDAKYLSSMFYLYISVDCLL